MLWHCIISLYSKFLGNRHRFGDPIPDEFVLDICYFDCLSSIIPHLCIVSGHKTDVA